MLGWGKGAAEMIDQVARKGVTEEVASEQRAQ